MSKLDKLTKTIVDTVNNASPHDSDASLTRGHMDFRMRETRAMSRGDRKRQVILKVPVEKTRMWKYHDREYQSLNEKSCADLIASFKISGQEIPALARRVEDPQAPEIEFELIYGARRRWTAEFLGLPLSIYVEDIDDAEAFRRQDHENRDRKDVTPYERAMSYKRVLDEGLFKDQNQLANYLGVSKGTLSKLLSLARVPDQLAEAFGGRQYMTPFAVTRISTLYSFAKNGEAIFKPGVLDAARSIAAVQKQRLESGKPLITANQVATQLLETSKNASALTESPQPMKIKDHRDVLLAQIHKKKTGLILEIPNGRQLTEAQFERFIKPALKELGQLL